MTSTIFVEPLESERAISSTQVRLLDWDSAHFGLRIGRVVPTTVDSEMSKEVLAWADLASLDCMYLLVDAGDAGTMRVASESGWHLVDVRVTLGKTLSDSRGGVDCVRAAVAADIPDLKRLARRSHRNSRFYADGRFSADACDGLYATWIERSVLDRDYAGAVFVRELEEGQRVGYISCSIRDGRGEIGLIAVDEKVRRAGVGTQLLAAAARWSADRGARRLLVATQAANPAALRLYERCGFAVESLQAWFHWWRQSGIDSKVA